MYHAEKYQEFRKRRNGHVKSQCTNCNWWFVKDFAECSNCHVKKFVSKNIALTVEVKTKAAIELDDREELAKEKGIIRKFLKFSK